MTHDIQTRNGFMEKLVDVTRQVGFSVLVYNHNDSTTVSIQNGGISDTTMPENLLTYINNENEYCRYFSHGDSFAVLYFLRFKTADANYVVIVQDNKNHFRINKLITALFNALEKKLPQPETPQENALETIEKEGLMAYMEMRLQEMEIILKKQLDEYERLQAKTVKMEEEAVLDGAIWLQEKQELENRILEIQSADNRAYKEMETKLSALLLENKEHKAALTLKDAELARLNEELSSLKNVSESNASLQTMAERLQQEKQQIEAALNEANASLEQLNSDLEKLQAEMEQSVSTEAHTNAVDELNRHIAYLEEEKSKLTAKLNEFIENTVSKEENNKLAKDLANIVEVSDNLSNELIEAKNLINELSAKIIEAENLYDSAIKENADKDSQVEVLRKSVEEHQEYNGKLSSQVEVLRKSVEEHQESNTKLSHQSDMLRKGGEKLKELINGLAQPIFTVDTERAVMVANRALSAFSGYSDAEMLKGRICSSVVYKNEEGACSWCMLEDVMKSGEPTQVSVTTGNDGSERYIDVIFFPIRDNEGNIIEVAEFINDKTETVELATSITKFKEKLRDFKKARIDDMNEINDVKKAYKELSAEHERSVERNTKMMKVIERLVSEDKARELLSVRTELMDVRNKLYRSSEMIKNYKYQLDEQLLKYSDLNRRTFMQMERLFNIIKGKNQMRSEETISVLSFLTREFEAVKKHFIETEKKSTLKTLIDARSKESAETGRASKRARVDKAAGEDGFRSEEERILQEKISSEKKTPTGIAAAAAYAKAMMSSAPQEDDDEDNDDDNDHAES